MRPSFPDRLESGRVQTGKFTSDPSYGPYGYFQLNGPCGMDLVIISSGGDISESFGWEHVSISTRRRPPNWEEMCFVKDLFWSEDECVVQFHPPKSEYVNNHPHCLHLWKPPYTVVTPPSILVGLKDEGVITKERAEQVWTDNQRKYR